MKPYVLAVAVLLAGCKPPEETQLKAVIGGVLIDGTGGPPVSDAVVVISGSRFRAAGPRAGVPIPAGSEKVDARGKFIVPGLIDVATEEFRQVSKLAEVQRSVEAGSNAFIGMISDTREIDPAFIRKLRDLQVVFAPRLTRSAGYARENTKKLADGGVLIAVASAGQLHPELEAMADAGLSPSDVLVAATRNGAMALKKKDELGTIEPGKEADLLVLSANPLEDVHNFRKVERRMRMGHWLEFRK